MSWSAEATRGRRTHFLDSPFAEVERLSRDASRASQPTAPTYLAQLAPAEPPLASAVTDGEELWAASGTGSSPTAARRSFTKPGSSST